MSKIWTTEIDSDIVTLKLHIRFEYDSGCAGDYDTPPDPPSITHFEVEKIEMAGKMSPFIVEQLKEEILDEIHSD